MKSITYGAHLQLSGIEKTFDAQTVLHQLNLEVKPGEFVAIVGKSGSGKSTLLRLIAGLDTPTRGEVRLDRMVLQGPDPETRVMFQDGRLLPWKRVVANVGLGLKGEWQERAYEMLERVGLFERAHAWPAVLSGGQRQRVALARALVNEPKLLLLDEPLGALDALTRIEMQQLIEKLWQEQRFTALLVTHDVEEAVALANRVVVLKEGRISTDISIPLSHPRQRDSSAFATLVSKILDHVMNRQESTYKKTSITV